MTSSAFQSILHMRSARKTYAIAYRSRISEWEAWMNHSWYHLLLAAAYAAGSLTESDM